MLCTWHTCQNERLPGKLLCKNHYEFEKQLFNGKTMNIPKSQQYHEQLAIKTLVDQRGFNFTIHFVKDASIQPSQIVDMYEFRDIDENTYNRLKKLLQEQLPCGEAK